VQIEQTLAEDMSLTIGFINSFARHIPVYRNVNCLPTGETLADGRPIYGTISVNQATGTVSVTPCTRKIFPQYNVVKMAESVGNQNYNGLFVQVAQRYSNGVQLSANYTLSRSRDDAPEENGPGQLTLSDPSNRSIDQSRSRSDVTHVFNMSFVARPSFKFADRILRTIFNDNQLSAIVVANSGETFNITTGDLNRDGVTGAAGPDRPVGIPRNAGRLPAFVGVDVRYSRFAKFNERRSLEFYVEATNVFNRKQVAAYDGASLASNNVFSSIVNPVTGELRRPLPDTSLMLPSWRESRQVQLGVKVHF
jgi:hypothetical protein